jgi:hypothetical protein
MRSALLLPLALILVACGDQGSTRDTTAQSAWIPPPPASNGAMSAQVLWIARERDHVAVRLRIENHSPAPVQLRNLGDTLTGFRCGIDGRSYSAEARHHDQPSTAARLAELPGQTPVELDLSWRIDPLHSPQYDCIIVVSNLFQDGKKLDDLTIPVPAPVHEERNAQPEQPAPPKPAETKPKDVSL